MKANIELFQNYQQYFAINYMQYVIILYIFASKYKCVVQICAKTSQRIYPRNFTAVRAIKTCASATKELRKKREIHVLGTKL